MPLVANALATRRRRALANAFARIPADVQDAFPVPAESLRDAFAGFGGTLVFRGDPAYADDRQGNSLYPDLAYPVVIAYCASNADIALCLRVAHDHPDLSFTLRSGGHSNCGYSVDDGMVIDISRLDGILLSPDLTSVVVQAGGSLGALNEELERFGLHVPGGECDTVGVAGHSMGGGYGFTSRTFGLNCDAIERVWMMLADGRTVIADAVTNPDLFWAVRGGTGNTFGVLLSIEYRTVKLPPVWGFVLTWPIEDSPAVLVELQARYIRTGATSKLGFQCAFARNGATDESETFFMMGMYSGDPEEGRAVIAPLIQGFGGEIMKEKVGDYAPMNSWLLDWYTLPDPISTTMEVKQSNYIDRPLSEEEWGEIIRFYLTKPNPYNMCAFEIYGGVATNPAAPNAFIHRQVDCDMFIDSFSNTAWPDCPPQVADRWVQDFDEVMRPFSNGHKYQNYPNPNNVDYRWNYWGDAYNSLLFVKGKYDPTNFFHFEQGITPYPPGVTRSEVPSQFTDPTITYR